MGRSLEAKREIFLKLFSPITNLKFLAEMFVKRKFNWSGLTKSVMSTANVIGAIPGRVIVINNRRPLTFN